MPPAFSGFRYSLKPIRSFVVAGQSAKRVFALDVPAIHVFLQPGVKTGMPGTWPGMTIFGDRPYFIGAF